MPLFQLIYASRPFGFDDLILVGILASASRNNPRNDITGALICREDLFVQLLEGPEEHVRGLLQRIERDDRHTDIALLFEGHVDERMFPDWAMRHDPAQSWMWTPEQVNAGAVSAATTEEARAIFTRLAAIPPTVAQLCPVRPDKRLPS
jgi:Sensors of blue-light using FAD